MIRKITALLAAAAMMFMLSAVGASGEDTHASFWGFEYEPLTENTVEIVGYTGSDEDIVIPREIAGKEVTYIGWNAFKTCSTIKSVTIPDTVTAIGKWAFSGCYALETVEFPDTVVSISSYAFSGCPRLRSADLPESLRSVGENAFLSCGMLSNMYVPNSLVSIGDGAFSGCPKLTMLCGQGTKAQKYAEENYIRYIAEDRRGTGDIDGDGSVSSADALMILRISVGLRTADKRDRYLSDADGDGSVLSSDALEILRRSVGI